MKEYLNTMFQNKKTKEVVHCFCKTILLPENKPIVSYLNGNTNPETNGAFSISEEDFKRDYEPYSEE